MPNYWIKAYIEILDDPKMATLPDRLWRRAHEMFYLAGRFNKGGELPETSQLAWVLRMTTDDLELDLRQLALTGIIEKTPTGWFVVNFAKRQSPVPGSTRVNEYRKRQHTEQYNGGVTPLKRNVTQITESESYTESEEEGAPPEQPRPNIFRVYEENIGALTPLVTEKLLQAEHDYPEVWFVEAVKEACNKNIRNLAYVEAILKRWQVEGFKSDSRPKRQPRPNGKKTVQEDMDALAQWVQQKEEEAANVNA